MLEPNPQVAFFERLKRLLPAHRNLALELAEMLEISVDSVYRRIRGESALSYHELLLIQQKMNLKPGALFPSENVEEVVFEYERPVPGYDTFLFLQQIERQMNAANRRNNMRITLASDDLPFFMHFLSPGLLQFKLLVFSGREIHDLEKAKEYDPQIQEICESIIKSWLEADAVEIWGSHPLDSTLKQISYYTENRMIGQEYARFLFLELKNMADLISGWASGGRKFYGSLTGGEITLYQSELNMGEMTLVLSFGEESIAYKSNYGYGYLRTEHSVFAEETLAWMRDLASKSVLISGSGEKYRNKYVSSMKESIKHAARLIGIDLERA
jgi:transcriptional regulator with XRE-family HTH domain